MFLGWDSMKILFISREQMTLSIDPVLDRLGELSELTVLRFSPDKVRKIKKSLLEIDYSEHDCVVLNIPFRRWYNKKRMLKRFPKLAVYDFDTNRNFLKGDKFYKKYEKFYKKLNHIKLICSGFYNTARYRAMGIDASFISKGYDSGCLCNLMQERDIELGFIGRIEEDLYKDRKVYLKDIEKNLGLQLLRTETKDEYLQALNRIKIFVSADIGYNEYMAKNFEAMACGCLLLAKRQENGEEGALGLIDMHNVVLYSDLEDAKEKAQLLMQNDSLVKDIAARGQKLVEDSLTFRKKGEELYSVLKETYGE